ncbi:hypothetical protein [Arthrobacter sp. Leaf137]|uniref:hypothetical protein n=1 Tax=Arthrobacter sp. Leaf137 TaxID=1736271 RepID=UPI0006FD9A97|nr:hypothetical protein [Arthrobacter sp. Leaf137]KQQ80922.1 hypothetical protein ASF64_12825 [Arthrobacter sp. Leaf137]
MTAQRAPFRLLRTAALAGSILSLAAAAHVGAGGHLPPAPLLSACLALLVLGVTAVTRWKLKAPVLGLVLAGGQGLLHSLLSTLSPAAAGTSAVRPVFTGTHRHTLIGSGALLPVGQDAHPHPAWDLGPAMFTAHLAATVLTALLLAKGEAALWALAAWLRPILFLAPVTFVPVLAPLVSAPRRAPVLRWIMLGTHPRRGPPGTV